MRVTYIVNRISVVGRPWMGGLAAMDYTIDPSDLYKLYDASGQITRDSILLWADTHCGDFNEILDFTADIGEDLVIPWLKADNELVYNDCMYGTEE
jgi:hypothetical protein